MDLNKEKDAIDNLIKNEWTEKTRTLKEMIESDAKDLVDYRKDFAKPISEVIKRVNSKWQVQSHKGKNLGTSDTKAGAVKRLAQVEYFKSHHKNEWVMTPESIQEKLHMSDADFFKIGEMDPQELASKLGISIEAAKEIQYHLDSIDKDKYDHSIGTHYFGGKEVSPGNKASRKVYDKFVGGGHRKTDEITPESKQMTESSHTDEGEWSDGTLSIGDKVYDLKYEVDYSISGGYSRATFDDPAEYPDVDFNKLTVYDIVVYDVNLGGEAPGKPTKWEELPKEIQAELEKQILDKWDNDFEMPEPDHDEPDYDDNYYGEGKEKS